MPCPEGSHMHRHQMCLASTWPASALPRAACPARPRRARELRAGRGCIPCTPSLGDPDPISPTFRGAGGGTGCTPRRSPRRFGYSILFSGQSQAAGPSQRHKSCFGNALFNKAVICQKALSPAPGPSREAAGCQPSRRGGERRAAQPWPRTGRLHVAAPRHGRPCTQLTCTP